MRMTSSKGFAEVIPQQMQLYGISVPAANGLEKTPRKSTNGQVYDLQGIFSTF